MAFEDTTLALTHRHTDPQIHMYAHMYTQTHSLSVKKVTLEEVGQEAPSGKIGAFGPALIAFKKMTTQVCLPQGLLSTLTLEFISGLSTSHSRMVLTQPMVEFAETLFFSNCLSTPAGMNAPNQSSSLYKSWMKSLLSAHLVRLSIPWYFFKLGLYCKQAF